MKLSPIPLLFQLILTAVLSSAGSDKTFDVTGQILADEESVFILRTDRCGMRVNCPENLRDRWTCGDVVRVRGHGEFYADELEVVCRHPLPDPVETTARRVAGGEHDYGFVRLRGVIASVTSDELDPKWNWFVLRTDSGAVSASVLSRILSLGVLRSFVDADVELIALATPFSSWRKPLGSHLLATAASAVKVLRQAPADPFSVPPLASASVPHRQCISGSVIATSQIRFFIRTSDGRILAVHPTEGHPLPEAGNEVCVSGFAEMDPFQLRLTDAVVRVKPGCVTPLPEAADISAEDLFTTESMRNAVNTDYHGRTVRIRGTIAGVPFSDPSSGILRLDCDGRPVTADLSGLAGHPAADLAAGSRVEITGLCLAEFENATAGVAFPPFKGFTILPRAASDIRILSRPPWWTPFRLLCVIAGLLAVIIAILIWNRALNVLSERRGRELYREQIEHAGAELKVEERTRLAVELHDSISQTLTGVSLQIDSAISAGGERLGPILQMLTTARQMLTSCRRELRCCLWDLRSRTFEEKDMTEAVRRTVAPHSGEAEISVRFNVPRQILSESTAHTVLQIVRELTVNAIRHGKASQIRIAGELRDDVIHFSVRDNGCGFNPESAPGPAQGHFGLLGIRERLSQSKGALEIQSAAGKGTKITVSLSAGEFKDESQT